MRVYGLRSIVFLQHTPRGALTTALATLGSKAQSGFLPEASALGNAQGICRRPTRKLKGAQAVALESGTKFELQVFEELAIVDSNNDLPAMLL